MKKTFTKTLIASALTVMATSASAASMDNIGVGVGYEAISGATLELNYPINDSIQLRGSVSGGMGLKADRSENGMTYAAKADGGIHRLALNYHPFDGNFFLSGGYAINNFNLGISGSGTGSTTVGTDTFNNASLSLSGAVDWSSAPTVSFGWGNSPSQGWGLMAEFGVVLTGAPNLNLAATGTYDNGGGAVDVSSDPTFQSALNDEETRLRDDIAGANFLPILQLQANYRF